ncbi:MAG: hypothetical protein AB1331_10155 [Bacillota bacterium]
MKRVTLTLMVVALLAIMSLPAAALYQPDSELAIELNLNKDGISIDLTNLLKQEEAIKRAEGGIYYRCTSDNRLLMFINADYRIVKIAIPTKPAGEGDEAMLVPAIEIDLKSFDLGKPFMDELKALVDAKVITGLIAADLSGIKTLAVRGNAGLHKSIKWDQSKWIADLPEGTAAIMNFPMVEVREGGTQDLLPVGQLNLDAAGFNWTWITVGGIAGLLTVVAYTAMRKH